jgi:hypothetical protein
MRCTVLVGDGLIFCRLHDGVSGCCARPTLSRGPATRSSNTYVEINQSDVCVDEHVAKYAAVAGQIAKACGDLSLQQRVVAGCSVVRAIVFSKLRILVLVLGICLCMLTFATF